MALNLIYEVMSSVLGKVSRFISVLVNDWLEPVYLISDSRCDDASDCIWRPPVKEPHITEPRDHHQLFFATIKLYEQVARERS